jgi:hypothetical protein
MFDIPDDLTMNQVETLMVNLGAFWEECIRNGHTPNPECEACQESVGQYIERVRLEVPSE